MNPGGPCVRGYDRKIRVSATHFWIDHFDKHGSPAHTHTSVWFDWLFLRLLCTMCTPKRSGRKCPAFACVFLCTFIFEKFRLLFILVRIPQQSDDNCDRKKIEMTTTTTENNFKIDTMQRAWRKRQMRKEGNVIKQQTVQIQTEKS